MTQRAAALGLLTAVLGGMMPVAPARRETVFRLYDPEPTVPKTQEELEAKRQRKRDLKARKQRQGKKAHGRP